MNNYSTRDTYQPVQSLFERYPWAGIHNDAIACITRYMDCNLEIIIKQFDERILKKVAKDHLFLHDTLSLA